VTDREGGFRVAVVGGGISGLATAWYLARESKERGLPVVCTVLEESGRAGGKILTESVETEAGPFIVEGGPDSFLALQKPWGLELAKELGLSGDLVGTNDESRRVYVLSRGRSLRLPEGVFLLVPTKLTPFLRSPLISPAGKLRMGLDLVIPRRAGEEDEALADFVTRRLGREALDKIAEPLLSGIYSTEVGRQSLLATFPRFREMEQNHGSLIRAMLAEKRKARSRSSRRNAIEREVHAAPTNALPNSVFVSFRQGTNQMIDGLVRGSAFPIRSECRVVGLDRGERGEWSVQVEVKGSSGPPETVQADAVVLAVPSFVAAHLIEPVSSQAAHALRSIRYVGTGTISLAYREDASWSFPLQHLRGFGILVPASEKRPVNAITWSSVKFSDRAPQGHSLLRVFFGGSRSPTSMQLDDAELFDVATRQVREIMGVRGRSLFHRIYRWEEAIPQYDVGHLQLVQAAEDSLPPRVWVTGSPYRGIGIPDCARQARETAGRVLDELGRRGECRCR
jgi:oxygen-dependent protoporphyrinogen oxidase